MPYNKETLRKISNVPVKESNNVRVGGVYHPIVSNTREFIEAVFIISDKIKEHVENPSEKIVNMHLTNY